jgi:hypothetical protein
MMNLTNMIPLTEQLSFNIIYKPETCNNVKQVWRTEM